MGTRSLTKVIDERNREILCLFSMYDGHPSGYGEDLYRFLQPLKVINGISSNQIGKFANGAGCLAAQLVAAFKTDPGGFYIYPVGSQDVGEDYEYHIHIQSFVGEYEAGHYPIRIACISADNNNFVGDVSEFGEFCKGDSDVANTTIK